MWIEKAWLPYKHTQSVLFTVSRYCAVGEFEYYTGKKAYKQGLGVSNDKDMAITLMPCAFIGYIHAVADVRGRKGRAPLPPG